MGCRRFWVTTVRGDIIVKGSKRFLTSLLVACCFLNSVGFPSPKSHAATQTKYRFYSMSQDSEESGSSVPEDTDPQDPTQTSETTLETTETTTSPSTEETTTEPTESTTESEEPTTPSVSETTEETSEPTETSEETGETTTESTTVETGETGTPITSETTMPSSEETSETGEPTSVTTTETTTEETSETGVTTTSETTESSTEVTPEPGEPTTSQEETQEPGEPIETTTQETTESQEPTTSESQTSETEETSETSETSDPTESSTTEISEPDISTPSEPTEPILTQQHLEAEIFTDNTYVKRVEDSEVTIAIDGILPEGVTAKAFPVESTDENVLFSYDITLFDQDDHEYQPQNGSLKVAFTSQAIRDALNNGSELEVKHEDASGKVTPVESESDGNDTISFEAASFSVYTIIEAEKEPQVPEADYVATLEDLASNPDPKGFYIFYNAAAPKYMTNKLNEKPAFIETSSVGSASPWFFESTETANRYYLYTMVNGAKKYVKNTSGNLLGLVDTKNSASTFDVSLNTAATATTPAKFLVKLTGSDKYLQHSNGGQGMRLYDGYGDETNTRMMFMYVSSTQPTDDYYELDGKTFGIAYTQKGVKAAGLMSDAKTISNNRVGLESLLLAVRPDFLNNGGQLLVAKDSDLTDWTFELVEGNTYRIYTRIGGAKRYLSLNGQNLSLIGTPDDTTNIVVTAGTGDNKGKYSFSVGGYSIFLQSGDVTKGFVSSADNFPYKWLNLTKKSNLTEDDFVIYSAEKVNLSDKERVPSGAQVIVYTRKWNDDIKEYEFYCLNHDGALIRCYENGDMIQWVGSSVNTALWDFTEYYDETTGKPTGFYELKNDYSGKYISPQVTGNQILADGPVGINMNGRLYGYSYSAIMQWDDELYKYAALKNGENSVYPAGLDDSNDTYFFAIVKPEHNEGELTEVETLDHTEYGIKMRIVDFNGTVRNYSGCSTTEEQHEVIGYTQYDANIFRDTGLLSTKLNDNGYPTAVKTGKSLGDLYTGAFDVNHLFIKNTYVSSGYFEFDSTQNYATLLQETGDPENPYTVGNQFTVYEQLGSHDGGSKPSLKHGVFFPFNTIEPGHFCTVNPTNEYDSTQVELPDSDPRKSERLYKIDNPDYYFGVELEAAFTQTPSGHDAWGHDIIYEFTGDDDFWLYVDDELIIDLGGVHSASGGRVNYSTGEIEIILGTNKKQVLKTTLYDTFKAHYMERGMSEAEAIAALSEIFELENINGADRWVFKDYSDHKMRIFYMERGAGSSNLHMRFNLSSVKKGSVLLNKEISGVDDDESFMLDFPFQIYYQDVDTDELKLLVPRPDLKIKVEYQDTNREVTHYADYTTPDGLKYQHVYMLKPGEQAVISFPDTAIKYKIVECGTDQNVYDAVLVNGVPIEAADPVQEDPDNPVITARKDYGIELDEVEARKRVTFDNHVREGNNGNLTITKHLFDEHYERRILHSEDDTTFSFRLYLGTESDSFENLPPANMYKYHVKDENGNYCVWAEQSGKYQFVSTGKTNYADLTASEKRDATFTTSLYGSISKIPADYTVELRDITAATKYKVEERISEMPDGYTLRKYWQGVEEDFENNRQDMEKDPPKGIIIAGENAHVQIDNIKGWGLRIFKQWTDADYMQEREPVYFAVYYKTGTGLSSDPIEDTIYQLPYGSDTLYWFFDKLVPGVPFMDYEVREVVLNGDYTVDSTTGLVTLNGATVTPIASDGSESFVLQGRMIGSPDQEGFTYVSEYEKGQLDPDNENVCIDKMINRRKGINLIKTDWEGNPLAGATFTLKDSQGNDAGAESYTSDENGLITTAYLRDGEEYTLTEIASPCGYHALQTSLKLVKNGDTVTATLVEGTEDDYFTLDNTVIDTGAGMRIAEIKIKNLPYIFEISKTLGDSETKLQNVKFALYAQVKGSDGRMRRDYRPIEGFEELLTDENGKITALTEAFADGTLKPGIYYLSEIESLEGYLPLACDILFAVTPKGVVLLNEDESPDSVYLRVSDIQDNYTIVIPNVPFATNPVTIGKTVVSPSDPDKDSSVVSFTYIAKLYYPDGRTPWDYTEESVNGSPVDFVGGTATFSLGHNETKVLNVPIGAVLEVTEAPNDRFTTKYQIDEEAAEDGYAGIVKADAARSITYTNTRKLTEITIRKNISDPALVGKREFHFTGTLTDQGTDITSGIPGLSDFVVKNGETKKFKVPQGSVISIVEDTYEEYTTTYSPASGQVTVGSNSATITATNTRNKKDITVAKVVEPVDAQAEFNFSVVLYKLDGTTVFAKDYALADGIKTDNSGRATFKLKHGESQILSVPQGIKMIITEVDPGAYVAMTSSDEFEDAVTTDGSNIFTIASVDSAGTVTFTNSTEVTDAHLTLRKTVTGAMGERNKDFTFTLNSVENEEAGTTYAYTKTDKSGTETTGTLVTGGTFTLKDTESIVITVPQGRAISLSEENGHYATTWQKSGSSTVTSGDTYSITLTEDAEVTVTNNLKSISPTGVSLRKMPFIIMGIFSTFMIITVILDKRRRRQKLRGIRKVDLRNIKEVVKRPKQ